MRNKTTRVALISVALAFATATIASAEFNVSIGFFHDSLAPHGRWVASASYGDVWAPSGVAAGWAPYVDGEWQWTDYGWTWVSSDPWGDIAYHYGTWVWSPPYGWVWVPGTVWAPAWVTWAYSDAYIGWAPVPVSFALGVGGYVGPPVVVSQTSYVFVPARQFAGVRVASVRVPPAQSAAIYARAQRATAFPVQGGIVHNTGLPIAHVERAVGHRIEVTRGPERLRAAPIPQAQARSLSVVAPKSERAAAIRKAGGPQRAEQPEHTARTGPAESRAHGHEASPKREAAPAKPAESQAHGHEAPPEKEPVQAHPAPSESQAHGHAAKPKKAAPEHPKAAPEHPAPPAHPAPKENEQPPSAHAETRPAPHAASVQAQHANPHGNPRPQHAKPQHDNTNGNPPGHDKPNGPDRPNRER
jgi:hypothetical protein